jgi:hypothetical protein
LPIPSSLFYSLFFYLVSNKIVVGGKLDKVMKINHCKVYVKQHGLRRNSKEDDIRFTAAFCHLFSFGPFPLENLLVCLIYTPYTGKINILSQVLP